MGGDVEVIAVGVGPGDFERALADAISFADAWENRFSRFRPRSELSQLNAAAGRPIRVSSDFLDVLRTAIDAWWRTGGRFDPSILPALAGVGYDRDFADVSSGAALPTPNARGWTAAPINQIRVDRANQTVQLPPSSALDFGGIAKGIFVDHLAEQFAHWPGGSVNAGGDLRVWGQPPDGDHWVIALEDPCDRRHDRALITLLDPDSFAVATSAMNRRTWQAGGSRHHHLIDPATGRPIAGRLASATALGPDLATAEIATKALLVSDAHCQSLDAADASGAIVIDVAGTLLFVPGRSPHACAVHPLDPETRSA